MKLTASAELVHGLSAPTQVIGLLLATHSSDQAILASDQTILADALTISGDVRPVEDETASGNRRSGHASRARRARAGYRRHGALGSARHRGHEPSPPDAACGCVQAGAPALLPGLRWLPSDEGARLCRGNRWPGQSFDRPSVYAKTGGSPCL